MIYHRGQFVRFNMGYMSRNWGQEGPREIGVVIRDEDNIGLVAVAFPSGDTRCASSNLELVTEQ